jgi:hypothetical protein
LVPEVGIEPTWAQGPGDFESEKRRIRPPPQLMVLEGKNFPYKKLREFTH